MEYSRFLAYNVLGAIVWSAGIVLAGYYIGAIPLVQTHLNLLVYAVILLTLATVLFILYKLVKQWQRAG
jgi:hypothetical protein